MLLVPWSLLSLAPWCAQPSVTPSRHIVRQAGQPPVRQPVTWCSTLGRPLLAGFEDYGKVRSDPNLANLRKSPKFKPLLER